ncbi:MAG: transcription antitermination factor NusB [Oscillospiraceae bacterium]
MTRRVARELAVRLCFELSATGKDPQEILSNFFDEDYYATLALEDEVFSKYPDERERNYISALVLGIGLHWAELDGYVEKYSSGWRFERISRTALAIMKTAMYEILYMPDIPVGVSINEAVELAKEYEEPETVPFINGVLGSFARGETVQE